MFVFSASFFAEWAAVVGIPFQQGAQARQEGSSGRGRRGRQGFVFIAGQKTALVVRTGNYICPCFGRWAAGASSSLPNKGGLGMSSIAVSPTYLSERTLCRNRQAKYQSIGPATAVVNQLDSVYPVISAVRVFVAATIAF